MANEYQDLKNFVVVQHKAKGRKTQSVKKFKTLCKTCKKDLGYRFKTKTPNNCSKCSAISNVKTRKTTVHTGMYVQHERQTPFQGTVRVRSSYELFYIDYLNAKDVPFFYESKTFEFADKSTYTPDFFLPDTNEYIELKGPETAEYKKKSQQMKDEYPGIKITVLRSEELKSIGYQQNYYRQQFTLRVHGDAWRVSLLDEKNYVKVIGPDSDAICLPKKKHLYFKTTEMKKEAILHELTHLYISYENIDTIEDLTPDQIEEMICDLIANHLMKFLSSYMSLYKGLRQILEQRYELEMNKDPFEADLSEEQIEKLQQAFYNISKVKNGTLFNKKVN